MSEGALHTGNLYSLSAFIAPVQPEACIANTCHTKNPCHKRVKWKFKSQLAIKKEEKSCNYPQNTHGEIIDRPDIALGSSFFLFEIHKPYAEKWGQAR